MNRPLPADVEKLRAQVKEFVYSWLVDHDLEKALLFFSAQAASNEVMLRASCGGYIKEQERKSQEAIKAGIEKFLRDFSSGAKGRNVDELLDITRLIQANSLQALNDMKQDRYLLVKLSSAGLGDLVEDSQVANQLRAKLKGKPLYFSLMSVEGGMFYFLWVQDAGQWRIYHADLICN